MEFDGEEEIELSLGLGIGGCRKRERTEDPVNEAAAATEDEEEVDLVKRKKEMQALRRSEARRKREEKKKRMRIVRNNSLSIQLPDEGGDQRRERTEMVKSDAGEDTDQSASAYAFPIYSYPYPSYQYGSFANGFAIPCITPVYTAETVASSKIVASQTVSFRPFHSGNKTNTVNEVNGSNDEGSMKPVSNNGSVGCCSSAVSENRSITSPDGSSSDSASHWSRPGSTKTEQHSSSGSDVPGASNGTAFTNPSIISNLKNSNKSPLTDLPQPTSEKVIKESTNVRVSNTSVTKDNNVENKKPPRPRQADNQKPSSPLSEMPCVSTTGNGPDGKTITGFLYRYTTTAEVSIVCVCHGESFSPAEFVKHAGGVGVAHPLRHITVVPSAF